MAAGRWSYVPDPSAGEHRAWYICRQNCRRKGIPFRLSRKTFNWLIRQHCTYCGSFPRNRIPFKQFIFLYQGIDRKNNAEGYTKGNTVPCCLRCNSVKGSNLSHEEMIFVAQVLRRFTRAVALLRSAQALQARAGPKNCTRTKLRQKSSSRRSRARGSRKPRKRP